MKYVRLSSHVKSLTETVMKIRVLEKRGHKLEKRPGEDKKQDTTKSSYSTQTTVASGAKQDARMYSTVLGHAYVVGTLV